jgi:hypothetical protein
MTEVVEDVAAQRRYRYDDDGDASRHPRPVDEFHAWLLRK